MDAYLQLLVSHRFYKRIIKQKKLFLSDDCYKKTPWNQWSQIGIHAIK